MEATVIFPHQLFARHPSIRRGRPVFLIEDPRFFGEPESALQFHKNKLVLHRASMTAYREFLVTAGHNVHYVAYERIHSTKNLFDALRKAAVNAIYLADPVDSLLEKRLTERAAPVRDLALTSTPLRPS